jgi:APA family basic amino acid/polyamine antiporter
VGAATVCVGWSAYLRSFLQHTFGVIVPKEWSSSPIVWDPMTKSFHKSGAFLDLPALLISLLVTALLVVGVKESTRVNNVVVCLKLAVVIIFIFAMAPKVDPQNWVPFIPPNDGTFGHYGATGILQGASVVFFSYIGFDSVSCMAQVRGPSI